MTPEVSWICVWGQEVLGDVRDVVHGVTGNSAVGYHASLTSVLHDYINKPMNLLTYYTCLLCTNHT